MGKMSERAARNILGVGIFADLDEVRTAWKEQVKRTHPDQPGGCPDAFIAVGAAYELLKGRLEGDADYVRPWSKHTDYAGSAPRRKAAPEQPKAARTDLRGSGYRGAAARREATVSAQVRDACMRLIRSSGMQSAFAKASSLNGGFYADPRAVRQAESGANHVADAIRVSSGGQVEIKVTGTMEAGRNCVSVPAGTRDGDKPALIRFKVPSRGTGRIKLADRVRQQYFPWAESVEIAFAR